MAVYFDIDRRSIHLDVIELGRHIEELSKRHAGYAGPRDIFVRDLLEHLKFELSKNNCNLNIIIFNLQQEYRSALQGVYQYWSVPYGGTTYGIWLFKSGTFEVIGPEFGTTWQDWGRIHGKVKSSGPLGNGRIGKFIDFKC